MWHPVYDQMKEEGTKRMKDFKVRCVESSDEESGFKKNKVYEIKNGTLEDEEGYIWTCGISADIDSINKKFSTTCTMEAKFELIPEPQEFTKDMLKTGMWIETRNGEKGIVLLNTVDGDLVSGETWFPLDSVNHNLKRKDNSDSPYDIVKIYSPNCNHNYYNFNPSINELLWQRPEPKHYTISEAEAKLSEIDGQPVKIGE